MIKIKENNIDYVGMFFNKNSCLNNHIHLIYNIAKWKSKNNRNKYKQSLYILKIINSVDRVLI